MESLIRQLSTRPPDSREAALASDSNREMPAFAGLQTLLYGLACMYSGASAPRTAASETSAIKS